MLYSKTTNGFYDTTINTSIPSDAVTITQSRYQELLVDQQHGKVIESDSKGYPVSVVPVLTNQQLLDICSTKAKALLVETDWSVLPDVGLANQDEFVFYRLNLRNLVKSPVTNPVFEPVPKAVWK